MSFLSFAGEELSIQYVICLVILLAVGYYLFLKPATPKPRPPIRLAKPAAGALKSPAVKKRAAVKEEAPENTKARIKIFYGSQTGTADDFSHTLAKEAKKHFIHAEVIDMETYDHANDLSKEKFAVFVMATHGEGDPTDNAKEFYQWLADKTHQLPENALNGLHYSIFGLGNKTYEQYNAVARFVDKRITDLGGSRVGERGEGDDDCSLEEDFNKWKKKLWGPVCNFLGIDEAVNDDDDKFVPRFRLVMCPPSMAGKYSSRSGLKKSNTDGSWVYDIKNPYMATVTENRELYKEGADRSCRHIDLKIGELKYSAGDHIGVNPQNNLELVELLTQRLGVNLDDVFALVRTEEKDVPVGGVDMSSGDAVRIADKAVIGPCTVRQAFLEVADITTPPRKTVLKAFSDYATDPAEKARLVRLSGENSDEYNKYIKTDQRTVYEVLKDFPSVHPPLPDLLELLPRLAHRYYSISSSPNAHPGHAHITSVVVNFTTPTGRKHNGVCSTWLAGLHEGDLVPVYIRESNFHLPPKPHPLIMVGPGTGLAPFRGFLQEIDHLIKKGEEWESVLFFGARNRSIDFLYEEEINKYNLDKTLSHLHTAFSRDQEEKVYVQTRMSEEKNREYLWTLLNEKGAYFYVCGDARSMAKQVQQTLHSIAIEQGKLTEEEATKYIEDLQKKGRYLQDVWF